ncbi:Putative permease [Modestobacter italicus]|uniref:Permease n=1 Tax=Modestobacter italicus (strain DSM 44449 / CECT 9708 / BC 501) TaxID=2732864 RepID=I4EYK3_MODI5|nr:hypothetical protein [Modestobacter marinus]CCH88466.1 Putative permease [Modestobacter marinus]
MTSSSGAHSVGGENVAGTTRTAGPDVVMRGNMVHDPDRDRAVGIPPRRDRVRWGPVWAGLVVALPTFLLLEVITLALGWWDIAEPGGTNAGWISGINGLIAFFLGGLTAGASSMWRGTNDGLLHGILVWALGIVSILGLALLGGGALLGPVAQVVTDVANVGTANVPNIDPAQAAETAKSSASWASLGLGLTIAAAALGGVLGAKMWPSKKDVEREQAALR